MNTAAAESMFADTQLYQNIVRLCKFIGYHPAGFRPATMNMYIDNDDSSNANGEALSAQMIYPCTAIDTGMYDSQGKKIYFSTIFDVQLDNKPISMSYGKYTNVMLVNGRWKHYGTVFTASGVDYETFVLEGLQSDTKQEKYVANNSIRVFVVPNGSEKVDADWYSDPNEIFIQAYDQNDDASNGYPVFSKLYNNEDKVYSIGLNENKTYEIKFGNGIVGRKLQAGDKVHVLYLDTNGPDGYVDQSELKTVLNSTNILQHDAAFLGLTQEMYTAIFDDPINNIADYNKDAPINVKIDVGSLTQPVAEENVEDIRETAPNWFKTGNRLITKKDYEFFLKSNRVGSVFSGIVDVKCMNNWEYVTTFCRWLYNLGINPVEEAFVHSKSIQDDEMFQRKKDPYRYLSKARLMQAGYEFVDSADANNIYLWIQLNSGSEGTMKDLKSTLNTTIQQIKTMTVETYPLKPIEVHFIPSFTPQQLFYDNLVDNGNALFDVGKSYIEITVSDNIIYSSMSIRDKVLNILSESFNTQKCQLGQVVDYSKILDQIYQINGIERVRTVYYPDDYLENISEYDEYKARACDGLAFASWSDTDLIDIGDDLQINSTSRTLEPFQFPRLAGVNLQNKIKVIKRSMNTVNPVKF